MFLGTELLAVIEACITARVTTPRAITLQAVVITGVPTTDQQLAIIEAPITGQGAFTHTEPTQNQQAIPATATAIQPIQGIVITIDTPIIINHIVEQVLAMRTGAIGLEAIATITPAEQTITQGTIIRGGLANI